MRPRKIDRPDGDGHGITSAPRKALALGNPDEALALGDPDDVVMSGLDEAIASEASDGVRRLDVVGTAADAVLLWAPTPSAGATRLAFGSTAHADRTLWDDEVAVWLAKLAVHSPAPIRTSMHHQGCEHAAPGAKVAAGQ